MNSEFHMWSTLKLTFLRQKFVMILSINYIFSSFVGYFWRNNCYDVAVAIVKTEVDTQ